MWFSYFLPDWESTYETQNTSSKKNIFEINFSQWEIVESSETLDLEASVFKNNWKCESGFEELQGHQEGYLSQMIISYEKVPAYRKHESLTAHPSIHKQEKPYICQECEKAGSRD